MYARGCIVEHPELVLVSGKSCALPCGELFHGALSCSRLYCMGPASNSGEIEVSGCFRAARGYGVFDHANCCCVVGLRGFRGLGVAYLDEGMMGWDC